MSKSDAPEMWCPRCKKLTPNSVVPSGNNRNKKVGKEDQDPMAFLRNRYCKSCKEFWYSYEVSSRFISELLRARSENEKLKNILKSQGEIIKDFEEAFEKAGEVKEKLINYKKHLREKEPGYYHLQQ